MLEATSHAYNAWGQRNSVFPINAVTGANDRFGYNARWGYVRDTTGLYYCQNRYYDPVNGRWLNRDPIGYSGGMNLYSYCNGGPVLQNDPSGLQAMSKPPLAGAAVGAASAALIGAGIGSLAGNYFDRESEGQWGKYWGNLLGFDCDGEDYAPPAIEFAKKYSAAKMPLPHRYVVPYLGEFDDYLVAVQTGFRGAFQLSDCDEFLRYARIFIRKLKANRKITKAQESMLLRHMYMAYNACLAQDF